MTGWLRGSSDSEPMIWSLTPYNGEADILEIRLGTLDGVVDRHVLTEATTTHMGDPKPLHFLNQVKRFEPWIHAIDYQVVRLEPRGGQGDWEREHQQRDELIRALTKADDEDVVLISDLDEIPRSEVFREVMPEAGVLRLEMAMHMYYLNWRWPELPVRSGTRAILTLMKKLRLHPEKTLTEFVEAGWPTAAGVCGWHLAYQMSPERMRAKLDEIADEWVKRFSDRPLEHFEHCRRTGWDLFDRPERQCDWVGDEHLPPYAVENRDRFGDLFCEQPAVAA
jgi:hypothetical protein